MSQYKWLENKIRLETCESLGQQLGCIVRSINSGNVIVGYIDAVDDEGKPDQVPVLQRGFEIELDGETPAILKQLDMLFAGFTREGSTNLIAQLESRVKILEDAKIITP